MTQVPCEVETPSAPAILGTETLAMETSRMAAKLAMASRIPQSQSVMPVSGTGSLYVESAVAAVLDMVQSLRKGTVCQSGPRRDRLGR